MAQSEGVSCIPKTILYARPHLAATERERERESIGIRLRPLGNVDYVAYLWLLCQGSKYLVKAFDYTVSRRFWVQIPAELMLDFFQWLLSWLLHK